MWQLGVFLASTDATSMMMATPALSSAPSKVVPSVVISVQPRSSPQLRILGLLNHQVIAAQTDISACVVPYHLGPDVGARGFRRRIQVGIRAPRTGALPSIEAGKLAITRPCWLCTTS